MAKTNNKKSIIQVCIVIAVIVVGCVVFNIIYDGRFLSRDNINVLFCHAILPCFTAWGLCFVFSSDFADLSIGAVIILAANAAGVLGCTGLGYFGVIIGGIGAGIILMTINFCVFEYTKIPSWIAGIGMALIYEALAFFYSSHQSHLGKTIAQLPVELRKLGKPPYIYIVFGLGLLFAYILYNRTELGLNIRAMGNGERLSESLGINTAKTVILIGVICGFFVGCSAFLTESYNSRMNAQTGLTSLSQIFQPMAAYMLAQVLQSRINIMIGIPICSLFVYTIFNMLTFMGVPSGTLQQAVLGLIVIIFGVLAQRKETRVVK